MKTPPTELRILHLVGLIALLSACPLPYSFNGEGSGDSIGSDPSSPSITAPVTVSYAVVGGESGTLADGDEFYSNQTTIVTLETATENASIYYVTDGLTLTSLANASVISGSSGDITVSGATLDLIAVAVGPGMLPSPPVRAVVGVSSLTLTISSAPSVITEQTESASFVITASEAPDSDVTVNLSTGTGYQAGDITSATPGVDVPNNSAFTVRLDAGVMSTMITITSQPDADLTDEVVNVTLQAGEGYVVGAPASAGVTIVEVKPSIRISQEMGTINETGPVYREWLSISANPQPTVDLDVIIETGGTYDPGDLVAYHYTAPPLLPLNPPIPNSGGIFTVTILAGTWGVDMEIHAILDSDMDDETLVLTVRPDPLHYELGTPSSGTLTILDSGP